MNAAIIAGLTGTALLVGMLVGFAGGVKLGRAVRLKLYEDNARLRAKNAENALRNLFRPVDEATERKVMAEYLAEESAHWHEERHE